MSPWSRFLDVFRKNKTPEPEERPPREPVVVDERLVNPLVDDVNTMQDVKDGVMQVAFPDLPPPTPEIKELDTAAAATVLEAEAEFNEAFDKLTAGLSGEGAPVSSEELDELRQQAEAALDRGLEAATKVIKPRRTFPGGRTGVIIASSSAGGLVAVGTITLLIVRAVRRRRRAANAKRAAAPAPTLPQGVSDAVAPAVQARVQAPSPDVWTDAASKGSTADWQDTSDDASDLIPASSKLDQARAAAAATATADVGRAALDQDV